MAWHRAMLYRAPLYPPQIEAVQLVERHIKERTGKVITIRSSRQTMKNECSALIQARAFLWNQDTGGTYIRTAPTWKPQIVNSKHRLERFLRLDRLLRDKTISPREGYIYEGGSVQIMFLSTDRGAHVVGATASLCLDIDEAHTVDKGKFETDFAPMVAWHSAPIVMWGVAADKQDLLYEYRQHNAETDPSLNLQYPAAIWCELREEYATRYAEHRAKLGADHPAILTQYDLVDVDAVGGYLKPHHLASLFSGNHPASVIPEPLTDSAYYVAVIDIGGEAEEEEENPLLKSTGARDSTVCHIFEVDPDDEAHDMPMCRLRQIYWWTGKALGDDPA